MKVPLLLLFTAVASTAAEDQICVAIDKNVFADQRFAGWKMDKSVHIFGDTCELEYADGDKYVSSEVVYTKETAQELVDFVKKARLESSIIPEVDFPKYTRIQVNIITQQYTEQGLFLIRSDADIPELLRRAGVQAIAGK